MSDFMNDSNEDEYSSDSDGSDNGNDKLSHGEHKERGNACYKLKDYRGAIAWYTLAIETSNSGSDSGSSDIVEKDVLATYYNNRAAASTMMLLYSDALSDCDAILSFHPSFVKALLRKAKVLTILGRLEEANQLYSEALVLDHSNVNVNLQKEVKTLLQRVALIQSLLQLPNTTTNTSNSNTITSTSNSKEWLLPILAISKANASQAMKQIALILTKCPNYNDLLSLQLQAHIVLQQYNDVITTSNKIIRQNQKNSISNNNNNNSMMLSSSVSNLSANTSTSTSTSTQSSLSTSIIQQQQQQHSDNIIIYRAYAFYQIGKIDDAIKHLKQILSLDPDHKVAFTLHKALRTIIKLKEKADAMYKGRNYREAITLYTEALETRAAEQSKGVYKAKLYFNRASAYANLANTKTATTTDDDDDDDNFQDEPTMERKWPIQDPALVHEHLEKNQKNNNQQGGEKDRSGNNDLKNKEKETDNEQLKETDVETYINNIEKAEDKQQEQIIIFSSLSSCQPVFQLSTIRAESNYKIEPFATRFICNASESIMSHPSAYFTAFITMFFFCYCACMKIRSRRNYYYSQYKRKRGYDSNERGDYTPVLNAVYDELLDDFKDEDLSSYHLDDDDDSVGTIISQWSEGNQIELASFDDGHLSLREVNG
mmetsp:Transcript_8819/g.11084  ORF Transcript_8819/g.11084 Transcript_8819/m.11084 type:complete len:655 (-) Transcript_8819:296-2260(-)